MEEGWTCMLFLICFAVTLGTVLPVGYNISVVNTPAEFINKWAKDTMKERYSFDATEGQMRTFMSVFVSIFMVGGIFGSLFASKCSEKCGRKVTLLIAGVIFVISSVLLFTCRQLKLVEFMLAGRFLSGIAAALVYTAQPMYLMELAPPKLGGPVGVCTCIGVTGGIVVGSIFSFSSTLGTEDCWHFALSSFLIFVVIGTIPIIIFPESPIYIYTAKGDAAKTKASLARVRRYDETVNADFAQIEAQNAGASTKLGISQVITNKTFMMPLLVTCSFHIVQQMSGINALFYYSMSIFQQAGFNRETSSWLIFGMAVFNFVLSVICAFLVAKFNRRLLMILSTFSDVICLVIIALSLFFMDKHKAIAYISIGSIFAYMLFFNCGLGAIPFFIGSEICEIPARSSVMACGSFSNWFGNFMIGLSFPQLYAVINSFAFLPCAGFCMYGALLTYFYLPETRNHEAKEVAPLMAHGFKSRIKSD